VDRHRAKGAVQQVIGDDPADRSIAHRADHQHRDIVLLSPVQQACGRDGPGTARSSMPSGNRSRGQPSLPTRGL
jgi:hypothetical protein